MKDVRIHPAIIPALMVFSTLFYYFGELVDWAKWEPLRLNFFYSVHDVHRLLFLAPIILAGYTARIRGAIIITLVSFIIFLPRAFFISPYPDALLRMCLFTLFAGVVGVLTGVIHNQLDKLRRLDMTIARERDKLLAILDNIADGVVITGPDHKIKYMNSNMAREFGEGEGLVCYQRLHRRDTPCPACLMQTVITEKRVQKWQCTFPDGRTCEVVGAPYIDPDGTVCLLSTFRNIQAG